jgi:hypothetical protein
LLERGYQELDRWAKDTIAVSKREQEEREMKVLLDAQGENEVKYLPKDLLAVLTELGMGGCRGREANRAALNMRRTPMKRRLARRKRNGRKMTKTEKVTRKTRARIRKTITETPVASSTTNWGRIHPCKWSAGSA